MTISGVFTASNFLLAFEVYSNLLLSFIMASSTFEYSSISFSIYTINVLSHTDIEMHDNIVTKEEKAWFAQLNVKQNNSIRLP